MTRLYFIACVALLVAAVRLSKKGYGLGGHLMVAGCVMCLASPILSFLGPALGINRPHHPSLDRAFFLIWSAASPLGMSVIAVGMLMLVSKIPALNAPPNDGAITETSDK